MITIFSILSQLLLSLGSTYYDDYPFSLCFSVFLSLHHVSISRLICLNQMFLFYSNFSGSRQLLLMIQFSIIYLYMLLTLMVKPSRQVLLSLFYIYSSLKLSLGSMFVIPRHSTDYVFLFLYKLPSSHLALMLKVRCLSYMVLPRNTTIHPNSHIMATRSQAPVLTLRVSLVNYHSCDFQNKVLCISYYMCYTTVVYSQQVVLLLSNSFTYLDYVATQLGYSSFSLAHPRSLHKFIRWLAYLASDSISSPR